MSASFELETLDRQSRVRLSSQREGRVSFQTGPGPYGFSVHQAEEALRSVM